MIKVIIALCLFINGELKEHRVQDSMSECLKHKRIATRNTNMDGKQYVCGEVKAIMQALRAYRVYEITDETEKEFIRNLEDEHEKVLNMFTEKEA